MTLSKPRVFTTVRELVAALQAELDVIGDLPCTGCCGSLNSFRIRRFAELDEEEEKTVDVFFTDHYDMNHELGDNPICEVPNTALLIACFVIDSGVITCRMCRVTQPVADWTAEKVFPHAPDCSSPIMRVDLSPITN